MTVLVEGEKYPLIKLKKIIDSKFYTIKGEYGVIDYVGYYYSFINKKVVYLLPKVFIDKEKKVLFDFYKDDLINSDFSEQINNKAKIAKFKYLLILFYRSLTEYKKRNFDTILLEKNNALVLNSSLGKDEYSYLDIILNIVNFHKENKNVILFIEKKNKSKQHKKVSWEKTIKKTLPLLNKEGSPIYVQAYNKKKYIDTEETLLSIFYSVLNNINNEYKFNIAIDKIYTIYKGQAYDKLCKQAPKILRKIKYKYFSDTLVKIYKLMELYFKDTNTANSNKKSNEFIIVDNYHVIFESMIDKLFSDKTNEIDNLKKQKDGKIVDHIFEYDSLLTDNENIFYVGDSKYYKIGNKIEDKSIYKQFTYVKNIIQYNVAFFNDKQENIISNSVRYRDEKTEGYNISPNFFIQGRIDEKFDFDKDNLKLQNPTPEHTCHFKDRLFDRDTLFVHYYDINFLFVLKSYTQFNSLKLENFKNKSKKDFKDSLTKYLDSKFNFFKKSFYDEEDMQSFINCNFKELNGKMYIAQENKLELIVATNERKNSLLSDFNSFQLVNKSQSSIATISNGSVVNNSSYEEDGFMVASKNEPYGKKDDKIL
ncbi:MAG: hypothetical protein U9R39_07540 [Campylobacterota bacterium]|nr:hypothetical protein [Campylobacterota bacterium]